MLKKNPGETNEAFDQDDGFANVHEEAIQAKALPWRREEGEADTSVPKVQDEFPPWIKNKDYLSYDSPSNTLMGNYYYP